MFEVPDVEIFKQYLLTKEVEEFIRANDLTVYGLPFTVHEFHDFYELANSLILSFPNPQSAIRNPKLKSPVLHAPPSYTTQVTKILFNPHFFPCMLQAKMTHYIRKSGRSFCMPGSMEDLSIIIKCQIELYEEKMSDAMAEGNKKDMREINDNFEREVGKNVCAFAELAGEPLKSTLRSLFNNSCSEP